MNRIIYEDMICELIENYYKPGDGPYLKITSPADIDKAYSLGFTCMGYPNEVMKKLTREEFEKLKDMSK